MTILDWLLIGNQLKKKCKKNKSVLYMKLSDLGLCMHFHRSLQGVTCTRKNKQRPLHILHSSAVRQTNWPGA